MKIQVRSVLRVAVFPGRRERLEEAQPRRLLLGLGSIVEEQEVEMVHVTWIEVEASVEVESIFRTDLLANEIKIECGSPIGRKDR